jgi:Kef-type K+ transport system membrane component KefB
MGASGAESILAGANPLSDPMTLFLLQVLLIVGFSRLLAWPLSYLRQPKVIAEVIGGILLGKSALSRIPAFKNAIFPDESLPKLKLIAEFGLVLFLFLVRFSLF